MSTDSVAKMATSPNSSTSGGAKPSAMADTASKSNNDVAKQSKPTESTISATEGSKRSKAGDGDSGLHGIFNKFGNRKPIKPTPSKKSKGGGGLSLKMFTSKSEKKPATPLGRGPGAARKSTPNISNKLKQSTLVGVGGKIRSTQKGQTSGSSGGFKDGLRIFIAEMLSSYQKKHPKYSTEECFARLKAKYKALPAEYRTKYGKRASKSSQGSSKASKSAKASPSTTSTPTRVDNNGDSEGDPLLTPLSHKAKKLESAEKLKRQNNKHEKEKDNKDTHKKNNVHEDSNNSSDDDDDDDAPIAISRPKESATGEPGKSPKKTVKVNKSRPKQPTDPCVLFGKSQACSKLKSAIEDPVWDELSAADRTSRIAKWFDELPALERANWVQKAADQDTKVKGKTKKQRAISDFAVRKEGSSVDPKLFQSKKLLTKEDEEAAARKRKLASMSKEERQAFFAAEKEEKKKARMEAQKRARQAREAIKRAERLAQKEAERLANIPLEDTDPETGELNPELPQEPLPTPSQIKSSIDPKLYLDVLAICEFCVTFGTGFGEADEDGEGAGTQGFFSGDAINTLTPDVLEASLMKRKNSIPMLTIQALLILRLIEDSADDGMFVRDGIASMESPLKIPMKDLAVNQTTASEILRLYLECADFSSDVPCEKYMAKSMSTFGTVITNEMDRNIITKSETDVKMEDSSTAVVVDNQITITKEEPFTGDIVDGENMEFHKELTASDKFTDTYEQGAGEISSGFSHGDLTRSVLKKLKEHEFDTLSIQEMLHVLKYLCDRYCLHAELRKVINDVEPRMKQLRKLRREFEQEQAREQKQANDKKSDTGPKILSDEEIAKKFQELEAKRQGRVTRYKDETPEEKELREAQEAAAEKKEEAERKKKAYEDAGIEHAKLPLQHHSRVFGFDRYYNEYILLACRPGLYVRSWDGSMRVYESAESFEELIAALNQRGSRERELLAKMKEYKSDIMSSLEKAQKRKENPTNIAAQEPADILPPDLELKETLKLFNTEMCDGGFNELDMDKLEAASSPNDFAAVLLDVELKIASKYLQKPLGKKLMKSSMSNFFGTTAEQNDESDTPVVIAWREYGKNATTLAQVNLMYEVLYESINWDKSAKKIKCKVCRKKDNGDQLLLCDGCDCAFHTYCCKPRVVKIPEGDWFCKACERQRNKLIDQQRVIEDVTVEENEKDEEETFTARGRKRTKVNYAEQAYSDDDGEGDDDYENDSDHSGVGNDKVDDRQEESQDESEVEIEVPENCSICTIKSDDIAVCQTCEKGMCLDCAGLRRMPRSGVFDCLPCKSKGNQDTKKRGKKRRHSDPSDVESDSGEEDESDDEFTRLPVRQELAICECILKDIRKLDDAIWFLEPVSEDDVPDYYEVIKHPMDFETIKTKIDAAEYVSVDQFVHDARLVFKNCAQYNSPEDEVGQAGIRLAVNFEKMFKDRILKSKKKRKITY